MTETPFHLGGHLDKVHLDAGAVQCAFHALGDVALIVDVGCGPGWMKELVLQSYKACRWCGIDGDPTLLYFQDGLGHSMHLHDYTLGPYIPHACFEVAGTRLAWSVEFLEHVEERYIPNFMVTFRECDAAVVTAAPPGAPGHHHVNCRTEEYWHGVFAAFGFRYCPVETIELRKRSTMKKGFMQRSGMFFRKHNLV